MRRALILALALAVCGPIAAQNIAAQNIDGDAQWKVLLTGNLKYVAGELAYKDLDAQRKALIRKQTPPVTILSCSDSRVPPELVFNRSLGELFVIRSAGNIADELGLASIEYAIAHGWTQLIVVLGHENCGAVGEALELGDPPTPSLLALVTRIRMSFIGLAWNGQPATPDQAIEANARASAAWLTANSKVVRDAVAAKKVKVIAAYYSLTTGEVRAIE
jgi:carbonic anhydrase